MGKKETIHAICRLIALLAILSTSVPAVAYDSHSAHTGRDLRGTSLGCLDCHRMHGGTGCTGMLADCQSLEETTICDRCHSQGGAFDGSNDPVAGAKANWANGVYDESLGRSELKPGLENWCAGCHDDGSSICDWSDVSAPNVMGDNATYGYLITGHRITCTACHDVTAKHIDGEARTYTHDSNPWDPNDLHNYQNGYRLKERMIIPLGNGPQGGYAQDRFALCFTCHNYAEVLGTSQPYQTNFQDDGINRHQSHLSAGRTAWDSDWDYLQVPDEIIIDNISAVVIGEWPLDTTLAGYYGTDYQWHSPGIGTDTAAWTPLIPQSGVYKVYARWPASTSLASDAQFTVVYNGGSFATAVNQQVNGNMWNLLGYFSFVQGTSGYVSLSDQANGIVVADAVKFGDSIIDSRISCPACHNVHGSPNPAMIRHGELISTPGTGDKSPALSFRWYKADGYTPTIFGDESDFGDMPVLGGIGGGTLEDSEVCVGCHGGPAPIKYDRTYQTPAVPEGSWSTPPLPPSMRLLSPDPGSSEVAIDDNLSFLLLSNGTDDIDLNTLTVSLQGSLGFSSVYHYGIDSQLEADPVAGRAQCYQVVLNPETDFGCQETITVTVSVQDAAGHSLTSPSWTFEASVSSSVIWRTPQGVHSDNLFYASELLIDDHPETGNFESPFPDHWVVYDLGQSCLVSQIRFLLATSAVRQWTIFVSDDPADFGTAVKANWPAAVQGTPPEWVSTPVTPKQGRYLKIQTGMGPLTKDTLKEIDFTEN
ncbi:MAG: hypothetical protein AB1847_01035 [bacterium]